MATNSAYNIKHRFGIFVDIEGPALDQFHLPGKDTPGIESLGCFKTAGGLGKEIESQEWKTGCDANMRKELGMVKYETIALEKGIDNEGSLEAWFNMVSDNANRSATAGKYKATRLYVLVLDRKGDLFRLFVCKDAWVQKYNAGDLDAMSSDAWVENVQIEHDGWDMYVATFDPGTGDFIEWRTSANEPTTEPFATKSDWVMY